ncbi:RidA family protein [Roseibium sp. HPY-6]|uniref:RidA family protein n=1 Tax=Roseibium sp. HPY-6 TaxID=3229852 RepID=UPI0033902429
MSSQIRRLNPPSLPDVRKVGYSQISVAGPGALAFVSGQVAWSAENSAVTGSLDEQTALVIKNLEYALVELNCRAENIVNMRVYMTDLTPETQAIVMPQLLSFLDGAQPSLTGIGVSALAAPELKIEIEMVVQRNAQ